jgi:predicted permease
MENILEALVPIFLLIFLGYFFKRISFPAKEFWPYADKFTYYVLFPSLLIYKLSNASLDIDGFDFVSSAIITVLAISVVLVVLDKLMLFFKGEAFTSVYQGSVRFNTYVFLALTDAVFGDEGLILAAFLITFLIPFLNLLCIMSFAWYTNNGSITVSSFIKSVFTNPLILACIIGGGMNYLGISLFSSFENTLKVLSSAALPLGLLSVGVGLHLSHIKEAKLELFSAVFLKLALMPAFMFFIASAMGVEGLALSVLILFAAMPTASSAYILARQLGGDLKLMSSIITVQTLLSIMTISVLLQVIYS